MAATGTVHNNWMSSLDSSWLDTSECRCSANDNDGEKAIAVNAEETKKDTQKLQICSVSMV